MASDSDDSRRKHRRSASDDDAEKSSKRHKHRHHRSHHRYRHRSSKHDEKHSRDDDKFDISDSIPPLASNGNQLDDELEEGEILEEDLCVIKEGNATILANSNAIEYEGDEARRQADGPNLVHSDGNGLSDGDANMSVKGQGIPIRPMSLRDENIDMGLFHNLTLDKDDKASHASGKSQAGFRVPRKEGSDSQSQSKFVVGTEGLMNGDLDLESHKGNHRQPREFSSPYKKNVKRRSYQDEEKTEVDGGRSKHMKDSSSESTDDRYETLVHSPCLKERLHGVHATSRSRSNGSSNERSHSRGLVEDEVWSKRSRHGGLDTLLYDDRSKIEDKLNEKMILVIKEDSKSYGRDTRDRRSKEREIARDSKKVIDRTRIKDRELDRYNSEEKEREMSRDREQSKYDIRERDRAGSRDRKRETYLDRNGEYGADKHKRREKERGKSRDRGLDRDSNKEKEREWSYEKFRFTNRDRDQEKGKEKRREQDRMRGREKEWERESERDRGRREGRSREIDRDLESDREKYAHLEASRKKQEWHKHSRRSGHDRSEYNLNEIRRDDSETLNNSKINSFEADKKKLMSNQDGEEDYEEMVEPRVVDQEEEDLNRIKEESKRRRVAILEKYKNRQLDSQAQPLLKEMKKDNESAEGKEGSVSAALEIVDGMDDNVAESSFAVEKLPSQNAVSTSGRNFTARGLGEGTPKSERSDEIFCDDIFGDTPTAVRKMGKGDGLQIERNGLHDNWDDADGYYSYRFGEVFDNRYEVTAAHGKGVFSTVVRATNLKMGSGEPEEVAIKILRSNETMYKAGLEELVILKKLVGADPDDKRHCVRFLSSFKYRNHLCLVFESLHMNLREVLKKFGRNIGLKLTAVRAYAKQLFIALKHLKNCGVLHCDIKPDNMLVNEGKNVLKLCDFGNAMFAGKNEITPYLVSRFYRAPEIILGLPYDHPMDIWSVGCCLYELYTGKVLFPGPTNNDMLRLHMELKGPFPKKMLRRGGFTDQHFDQDLNFHATEEDPVTKKAIKRIIVNIKPKDIGSIITGYPGEDPKMINNFKDLLDKIFVLDPDKRMTVSQALNHPFITAPLLCDGLRTFGTVVAEFSSEGSYLVRTTLNWRVLTVECTVSIDVYHCFEGILQGLDDLKAPGEVLWTQFLWRLTAAKS